MNSDNDSSDNIIICGICDNEAEYTTPCCHEKLCSECENNMMIISCDNQRCELNEEIICTTCYRINGHSCQFDSLAQLVIDFVNRIKNEYYEKVRLKAYKKLNGISFYKKHPEYLEDDSLNDNEYLPSEEIAIPLLANIEIQVKTIRTRYDYNSEYSWKWIVSANDSNDKIVETLLNLNLFKTFYNNEHVYDLKTILDIIPFANENDFDDFLSVKPTNKSCKSLTS